MVEPSLLPQKTALLSKLHDLSKFLSISNSAEKLDVTETIVWRGGSGKVTRARGRGNDSQRGDETS